MLKQLIAAVLIAASLGTSSAADLEPIEAAGLVNASPAKVWQAWTTGAGLRAWLAPHAEFDLRLGGLMRTNYNANGTLGDEGTIENRVLAYEPERMITIQVARAPSTFPFPNAVKNMWTVLYFVPADGNRTHIRVVGMGFTDDAESTRMREFFKRGNTFTVQQLQKHFP